MGSSGRSEIPQQGNPTEARACGASFFLSTDGNRKQIPRVSQETGESPLGSVPERGAPGHPPRKVPLAHPPVAILLVAPRWRCRTIALSRPQPKAPPETFLGEKKPRG